MIRKRSKFWTFIFSCMPGAGQMFSGFMKAGLSLMVLFFGVIAVSSVLNLGSLLYALPVIWFYAFFDSISRSFLPDEEFYSQQDEWLFSLDKLFSRSYPEALRRNGGLYLGVGLLVLGVLLLWDTLVGQLYGVLPDQVLAALRQINRVLPRLIAGGVIIFIGYKLLRGRRTEDAE